MSLSIILAFLRRVPVEVYALLAAVLLMVLAMWWAYGEGKATGEDVRNQQQERIQALEEANAQSQEAIKRLQTINEELAEGRKADRDKAQRLLDMMREEALQAHQQLERERRERIRIYERNPTAAAWANAPVPDVVVDSLR